MNVRPDRRYVRVYDDDLRRDYRSIWNDDRALATWLRLLSVADKMWPTAPELPRSVKPSTLRTLVDCGLVELLPDDCYRIRGHNAERIARSNAGRNAAAYRWSNADAMPKRERERDENESPLPRQAGKRVNGTNPRAVGTNPRAQGTSPRQVREAEKKGGADSIHAILTAIQTKGKT